MVPSFISEVDPVPLVRNLMFRCFPVWDEHGFTTLLAQLALVFLRMASRRGLRRRGRLADQFHCGLITRISVWAFEGCPASPSPWQCPPALQAEPRPLLQQHWRQRRQLCRCGDLPFRLNWLRPFHQPSFGTNTKNAKQWIHELFLRARAHRFSHTTLARRVRFDQKSSGRFRGESGCGSSSLLAGSIHSVYRARDGSRAWGMTWSGGCWKPLQKGGERKEREANQITVSDQWVNDRVKSEKIKR